MHLRNQAIRGPLDLFHRTYHSLLRSSGEIQIQALIEPFANIEPSLHHGIHQPEPDLAALTYTSLRLPSCIDQVRLVLLGQSHEVFAQQGYPDVLSWQSVSSPGRRRKMLFDGRNTLAVLVTSPSDLDDLIPILVAFQVEWNKLNDLFDDPRLARLRHWLSDPSTTNQVPPDDVFGNYGMTNADLERLQTIWGTQLRMRLQAMINHKKRFAVRMLGGSLLDYERATLRWWFQIDDALATLSFKDRPVYFVSSNTHSLVNLLSGFALRNTAELLAFIREREHASLLAEYERIQTNEIPSSIENFFYYVQKKYQSDPDSRAYFARRSVEERELGIHRISSRFYLDIDAQVIEVDKLDPQRIDPRIKPKDWERLAKSRALIVNIDYPLGLAAYHILKIVARSVGELRGVYVVGKAATLNGKIGDVLIPNEVYDEHTDNTYHFAPVFRAADVEPYLAYGSVLDNQKALTSRGTFHQNAAFLDALYRDFFTDVEMEAGPYLAAIYEQTYAERYPTGQIVSFLRPPYDIGFLHYASDTPYSKGHNLGSRNLSYFGMDPTYATSLAVARRIVRREVELLKAAHNE
jgi:hypothetical protein